MKPIVLLNQLTLSLCCVVLGSVSAVRAGQEGTLISGTPQLSAAQKELAHDDGASAGKRSVAGSGHGVRFESPGQAYYLTAVRIFGSRYGTPMPPNENAYVWLCDAEFKLLSAFPFPYSSFERGEPKWVTIPIKPTRLPQHFIICIGFNPTATKGVYVHYDSAASGNDSLLGLPGRENRAFDKGDWLIRAVVQPAAPGAN